MTSTSSTIGLLSWRKPYVDGAVRELTSGEKRSPEQLRQAVEQIMLGANNRNADIRTTIQPSTRASANVRVDVDVDEQEALLRDMRRNPEKYDVE